MGLSNSSSGVIAADPSYYLVLQREAAEFLDAPDYFARFIVMKGSMSIHVARTT